VNHVNHAVALCIPPVSPVGLKKREIGVCSTEGALVNPILVLGALVVDDAFSVIEYFCNQNRFCLLYYRGLCLSSDGRSWVLVAEVLLGAELALVAVSFDEAAHGCWLLVVDCLVSGVLIYYIILRLR
jgi:hypothetical protein